MIITFPCPSSPVPIGGVTALYEFANALARRGHEVHLVHADFFGCRIDGLEDLSWFAFEPAVRHHLLELDGLDGLDGLGARLPAADVIFGTGAPRASGLPVLLLQGFEMLYPWIERDAFRTPCLKVCIASWLVDVGVFFGVPPEQLRVAPMGIDHDRLRPATPIEDRPPQVAMLHNEHPAKGWLAGRAALEAVHAERPDLRAVVFGTSAPSEPLPPWMTFLHNPDPDVLVREVYSRSAAFLQASRYEGFGFTAVEAMACGAALVTTDNGGSRDYAVPGETALVVAPGDRDAMATAILRLLEDDGERQRIATAGERYVRRFDWDRGAAILEQHLEDYLDDPEAFRAPPGPAPDVEGASQGELAARVLGTPRTGGAASPGR